MKRLIINADDYGLCESVSRGILDCYTKGMVSDFSFLINPDTFDDSLRMLREKQIDHCGVHLNIVMGKPLTGKINSLTDPDGWFNPTRTQFFRALAGRLKSEDVYEEFKCQFETLQKAGLRITHLDTHQNVHLIPQVYKAVLRIRNDYGGRLPIRIPSEGIDLKHRYKISNLQRILVFNILSMFIRNGSGSSISVKAIGGDFFHNPTPFRVLQNIIPRIVKSSHSAFECAVHPGYYSDEIRKYDPYAEPRETELAQLIAPVEDFRKQGIEVCSFRALLD
jgi:predicted glycoside hydrolase/deacetylase ChbG (UPF0249 family)